MANERNRTRPMELGSLRAIVVKEKNGKSVRENRASIIKRFTFMQYKIFDSIIFFLAILYSVQCTRIYLRSFLLVVYLNADEKKNSTTKY